MMVCEETDQWKRSLEEKFKIFLLLSLQDISSLKSGRPEIVRASKCVKVMEGHLLKASICSVQSSARIKDRDISEVSGTTKSDWIW